MTRVSERPQTQKTPSKTPTTAPPPPQPAGDEDGADVEAFDELEAQAQRSSTKADAFSSGPRGAEHPPRLARGDVAPHTARGAREPELVIDPEIDAEATAAAGGGGVSVESNEVAGTLGPVPPPRPKSSSFKTVDEAAAALTRDFGVKVNPGFSVEELCRIHESLALVPQKDRAALQGVELDRGSVADPEDVRKDGGTVGAMFFEGTELKPDGGRVRGPHIVFYDAAFPKTPNDGEDRRMSQSVVLHEAAHAITGRAAGDAKAEFNVADAARKVAQREAEEAGDPYMRSLADCRALARNEPSSRAFATASEAWLKAQNALSKAHDPASLALAKAALVKARREQGAALARLPEGHVQEMAKDLIEKQDAFATPELKTAERRVDAETALTTLRALVDADVPKRAPDKMTATTDARHLVNADPREVAAFQRAAKKPVTGYGEKGAQENFAEAYALYRRAPKKLQEINRAAYDYMKKHHP